MEYTLRRGTAADLLEVNQVIEATVMNWQLPERVKRLSLPSYRYDAADLMHLTLWVVENDTNKIVAVAGWESADPLDLPMSTKGLLLHGIYVSPKLQRQNLGQRLIRLAEHHAAKDRYNGVLVKAQVEAIGFFQRQGYKNLPVKDNVRHYSHRMWKNINH